MVKTLDLAGFTLMSGRYTSADLLQAKYAQDNCKIPEVVNRNFLGDTRKSFSTLLEPHYQIMIGCVSTLPDNTAEKAI